MGVTGAEAVARALADELAADPTVMVFGADVAAAGGRAGATAGLLETFGPDRIRDTSLSPAAVIGAAIGASTLGVRPVVDLTAAGLVGLGVDQIVNQLGTYRYQTNGQVRVPVTIRMTTGAGIGAGPQQSQAPENWFLSVPGVRIAVPGTVADLYGVLRSAIRDDNPVLVFEHQNLYELAGDLATDAPLVPLGVADVARRGADVTIVAAQQLRHRCLEAADVLAGEGIEATVIDPRTLVPFDDGAVARSLEETSRLTVVEEGSRNGSWGSALIARMLQDHFFLFDAPPLLIAADDTPVPAARPLENAWLPSVDRIVTEVRAQVHS
jgi:pyruvate dehydrogenase E1 component beta subunit